ncbi:hypothetical protein E2C01_048134 [Portunus trituberculatus]|uniref:Uncharacterized protein n=1 Tax=Portunus trituberculatus TaxID=210409 RepID=A0A5B7GCF2_PORTR|nr:hypothetical protein [Portunus trituberculatus]
MQHPFCVLDPWQRGTAGPLSPECEVCMATKHTGPAKARINSQMNLRTHARPSRPNCVCSFCATASYTPTCSSARLLQHQPPTLLSQQPMRTESR